MGECSISKSSSNEGVGQGTGRTDAGCTEGLSCAGQTIDTNGLQAACEGNKKFAAIRRIQTVVESEAEVVYEGWSDILGRR